MSDDVQPGDVLTVTTENSVWVFTFNDFIRTSTMSPQAQIVGRPAARRYVTSDLTMTTTYRLANDNQPDRCHPEDQITQGEVLFFRGWRTESGGDMHTGNVIGLRHNSRQIF